MFIVLCVFVLAGGVFLYYRNKDKNKYPAISEECNELINMLKSMHPDVRIFEEKHDKVVVGASSYNGLNSQKFYISRRGSSIYVQMIANNPLFGKMSNSWIFPRGTNQEIIIDKINQDMFEQIQSIHNRFVNQL